MSKTPFKTVMLPLESLTPAEDNPRVITGQAVNAVLSSISDFDFQQPIVVHGKKNTIIVGHTRYESAIKAGLKEVPCWRADDLTPEQIKQYRIIDNKSAELAQWDEIALRKELEKISLTDEVIKLNFQDFELDALFNAPWASDHEKPKEEKDLSSKEIPSPQVLITVQTKDRAALQERLREVIKLEVFPDVVID